MIKTKMDEMRVETGTKKLVSTWKQLEMKNWQRDQMPRKWRGSGNCDGGLY